MGETTRKYKDLRECLDSLPAKLKQLKLSLAEAAEETVKESETKYRKGDKTALFYALAMCCTLRKELPAWVRAEIVEASHVRPRSWDDLFGAPVPKGKRASTVNKESQKSTKVICRVREMHAQGEPIDDHLFQRVGKEFAISGGTAKNYYYNKDKQMLLDLSTAIVCLAAGGPDRLKAVVAQIVAQMETTSKKSQNT